MSNDIFKQLRNFDPSEFACKCGCGLGAESMDKALLLQLQNARTIAGTPFYLPSAIRCIEHNRREGGSDTSSHLSGHAVDIEVVDSHTRFVIKNALREAGFTRIGDSKDGGFIHADNDSTKTQEVEWLY